MLDRESAIVDNLPLVKSIAAKFNASNIGLDFDDLVSIGTIGLMLAYDTFDANKGVKFSTYATLKIKSYIIDELRRLSPITRTDMKKVKSYKEGLEYLKTKLNRKPTVMELSDYLGITIKDIQTIEDMLNIMSVCSLDNTVKGVEDNELTIKDTLVDDCVELPGAVLEEEEEIQMLIDSIFKLEDRDKLILSLYYYEELTLKEVGEVLGLSESRVCVLHNRALDRLKCVLNEKNYVGECVV